MIIFLCLLKCSPHCIKPNNQCEKDDDQENNTKIIPSKRWDLFAVILYGISVGIKTATFFGAVILIPISQLTVILSSTTPVSYIMRFDNEKIVYLAEKKQFISLIHWFISH